MNFNFSETQDAIRRRAQELAERVVAPAAADVDSTGRFPRDLLHAIGADGLARVSVPADLGGHGAGFVALASVIEEVARQCASTGLALAVHASMVQEAVARFGTSEQKAAWLPRMASMETLGALCLAEPDAPADPWDLQTIAEKSASGYRITGSKVWVTGGVAADVFLVFARAGKSGISAYLVERSRAGVSAGSQVATLGVCGSGCCDVRFEACEIPAENRVGADGDGAKIGAWTLDCGRIALAAHAIGISRAALEESLAHAANHRTGGRQIAEYQAVQFALADMATEIDAARLLAWKAAALKDEGAQFGLEAAVAKLTASETATRVAGRALQIFGAAGYARESAAARHYRDSKVTEIFQGSSEAHRQAIAASILA